MFLAAELGLGLAFTIISLARSIPDWIKKNDSPKTKVQVYMGIPPITPNDDKDKIYKERSYSGSAPNIALFNMNRDRIGLYRNDNGKKMIGQNSPGDILVDYFKEDSTEKAEYVTVSASGPDAICITSVTVTTPNTDNMWAITPGEVAA
ncbi:hypothetical protein K469DRAFT_496934, partial [Zopfia rhizophila CBS 207.26]